MKTIPKHLVTVLPRVRSNSVSSPRLYSSSSLSLFDSSAPPPSRPVLSSNRLCIEGKPAEVEGSQNSQHHSHSHPPFSLALAQPQSSSGQTLANSNPQGQYALFPYSSLTHPAYGQPHAQQTAQETDVHPRPKRQRLRYQLDVGAYGIPKRCRVTPPSRRHHSHSANQHHPAEDVALSVQVGEDAYFIRDNAMGVADGVGGWSKSRSTRPSSTPSALFARRLMHYCSAEVESASKCSEVSTLISSTVPTSTTQHNLRPGPGSCPHPPSRPQFSFTHHLKPRPPPPSSSASATPAWKWSDASMSSSLPASFTLHSVFNHTASSSPPPSQNNHRNHSTFFYSSSFDEYSAAEQEDECSDLEQDLEDSLEELSEGIDVLQILERAYDKTLKAHVVPGPEPSQPTASSSRSSRTDAVSAASSPSSSSSSVISTSTSTTPDREPKPLLAGSSTALLAVLDYPPRASHVSSSSSTMASAPISVASPATPATPSLSTLSSSFKTNKSSSTSVHSFFSTSTPTATATNTNNALSASPDAPKRNKTAQTPLKASTATAATAASSASRSSSAKATELASGATAAAAAIESSTPGVECEVLEECHEFDEQGEYDAVIKIAHVGDCMGMLVRGQDIVWRSEEMWWDFNTPVQLGPSTQSSVTPRNSAMVTTIPVKADDILILASDGLSDNLWDEDVLDEVVRFKKSFLDSAPATGAATTDSTSGHTPVSTDSPTENDSGYSSSSSAEDNTPSLASQTNSTRTSSATTLRRKTLAGMLSEALCSRARRVSERKASYHSPAVVSSELGAGVDTEVDEVPFARRAREAGRRFAGGKNDDISVVVAVISPRVK